MRRALVLALTASLAAVPATASADSHALRGDGDLTRTLLVTGAGVGLTLGSELAKAELAPTTCRWCTPGPLDRGARDAFRWSDPRPARAASDGLALGLVPAVAGWALLAAPDARQGGKDLLYVAEAVSVSTTLTQLTKFAVGRERPFVHFGPPGRPHQSDDDVSFFSGHTSFAFSLAAAAGTVADLRGYRSSPWVWGIGMTLAATVGYLRIAGDEHYLTDVLVGAGVGTLCGVVVPRLFHPREEGAPGRVQARATVLPVGIAIAF